MQKYFLSINHSINQSISLWLGGCYSKHQIALGGLQLGLLGRMKDSKVGHPEGSFSGVPARPTCADLAILTWDPGSRKCLWFATPAEVLMYLSCLTTSALQAAGGPAWSPLASVSEISEQIWR